MWQNGFPFGNQPNWKTSCVYGECNRDRSWSYEVSNGRIKHFVDKPKLNNVLTTMTTATTTTFLKGLAMTASLRIFSCCANAQRTILTWWFKKIVTGFVFPWFFLGAFQSAHWNWCNCCLYNVILTRCIDMRLLRKRTAHHRVYVFEVWGTLLNTGYCLFGSTAAHTFTVRIPWNILSAIWFLSSNWKGENFAIASVHLGQWYSMNALI